MAIVQRETCGRCKLTIYPEVEETKYCKTCKKHFCKGCDCMCYEDTIERMHHLFQPPSYSKKTKRYKNVQRTETKNK